MCSKIGLITHFPSLEFLKYFLLVILGSFGIVHSVVLFCFSKYEIKESVKKDGKKLKCMFWHIYKVVFFLSLFSPFFLLRPHLWHVEVPGLWVESEL